MPKVDLGTFTEDEMAELLNELLQQLPEETAITQVRAWLDENDLRDEI